MYTCVCARFHPREGVRNTTWDFVRHLQPGLLDLICGAATLIGLPPLHCVFYTEGFRNAFGPTIKFSVISFVFNCFYS